MSQCINHSAHINEQMKPHIQKHGLNPTFGIFQEIPTKQSADEGNPVQGFKKEKKKLTMKKEK